METLEDVSADKLRQFQYKNQIKFVANKIKEAVTNFKQQIYIISDFKFTEDCVYYFKHLGYNVLSSVEKNTIPYKYIYEINWK